MGKFNAEQVLSKAAVARIREQRVLDPDQLLKIAAERKRRPFGGKDGRLNVVVAEESADDRVDELARLLHLLASPLVDGLAAPVDVLEDLLYHHDLSRGPAGGILDGKLLLAAMVCDGEGVRGVRPATCAELHLDGVHVLALSHSRLLARALEELNSLGTGVIVELRDASQVSETVAWLGDSTRHLWFAVPGGEDAHMAARATFSPLLLAGAHSHGSVEKLVEALDKAQTSESGFRGALLGRNVLRPAAGQDPGILATVIGRMVHEGMTAHQALHHVSSPQPLAA